MIVKGQAGKMLDVGQFVRVEISSPTPGQKAARELSLTLEFDAPGFIEAARMNPDEFLNWLNAP